MHWVSLLASTPIPPSAGGTVVTVVGGVPLWPDVFVGSASENTLSNCWMNNGSGTHAIPSLLTAVGGSGPPATSPPALRLPRRGSVGATVAGPRFPAAPRPAVGTSAEEAAEEPLPEPADEPPPSADLPWSAARERGAAGTWSLCRFTSGDAAYRGGAALGTPSPLTIVISDDGARARPLVVPGSLARGAACALADKKLPVPLFMSDWV